VDLIFARLLAGLGKMTGFHPELELDSGTALVCSGWWFAL